MIIYSDEITRIRRGIRDSFRGEMRMFRWNFAQLPIGNIGDVYVCGKIFAGETIVEGRGYHSALGASVMASYGAGSVAQDNPMGQSLGAVSAAEKFMRARSFAEPGEHFLLNPGPCNGGFEAEADFLFQAEEDLLLICVNSGAAFAANGVIRGRMLVAR